MSVRSALEQFLSEAVDTATNGRVTSGHVEEVVNRRLGLSNTSGEQSAVTLDSQSVTTAVPTRSCSCGGEWESAGDGTRFCNQCRRGHPDDPDPEPLPETDTTGDVVTAPQLAGADSSEAARGPVGDTATVRRRTLPSLGVTLENAYRTCGKLTNHIHDLHEGAPDIGKFKRSKVLLNTLGHLLSNWGNEKGIVTPFMARTNARSKII